MIKVKDLSKNYGPVEAVKSISFDLKDGEVIGFLGANGAGKTTTLKMMTGYLVPTEGSITVNGMDIIEDTHSIQEQIGYLPELNPLYSEMRVYDYLEFLAAIRDVRGSQFKESLARVVEQCGLRGVVHKNISDCSKGYKQRIGLAAAMIHDPKILILDEPVTGLDPNQIIEIRSLIRSLGKEKLVFMSSHILQEIQATVDRIIIINEGEIVANGTNEELMTSFMGNVLLTMEVKGAKVDSIKHIQATLPNVKFISTSKEKSIHTIQLEYEKNKDSREEIFNYAVKNKWSILKMTPKTTNLEDIFRNLTMKGDADA
ncbi:MAG: ATP-binding cassette domain-containing protein [Candidatus Neomarinimicrobiota bacterium]|jgi:ABC-2 type transport system ATP-binding protein|nr:ATP-binding cassette domain-containing protein [Candidatus Neomarinimicrobiota bacterium]MEC7902403.1 ATP-binding cassette domain-containing protein [Candidatus Neomarinimicrobiota bacterium]MED5248231.1 ATP-binding cassette domain-containing protein [Candidatus Neomarinimicrobiota bacterium]|tara:strand:+ start:607 stop:1551 length:945 start_codon:yes stop_codon:yes gene_type:complete